MGDYNNNYMVQSRKEWELLNGRIWLAEIDIEILFPLWLASRPGVFCYENVAN